MLKAKRHGTRQAMEPFGVSRKSATDGDLPPPEPGPEHPPPPAGPNFVEDDEELDQAGIGSTSPGLGKLE